MQRVQKVVCVVAATISVAACTDYESSTNLNPEGPAMISQIRLKETYTTSGSMFVSTRRVFGFGTHPMATEVDAHPVTTASAVGNSLRIIVDELLVGNNLEEIACRAPVNANGAYARVPVGATPDDVAKCSAAQDVLPSTCRGDYAVCTCELAGGCMVNATAIAMGAPVGVLDINQDGAADDTRFIQGAVGLRCGNIDVPIDLDMSYWNPSGNQQVPAMGGFEALGPALVLVPQTRGLPTNLTCNLVFAPDVVDKQGNGICTPAGGDIEAGCDAGDVGAFSTTVEKLTITGGSFNTGATGVSISSDALFIGNTQFDPASINATTVTVSPAAPAGTVIAIDAMPTRIKIDWGGTTAGVNLTPMTEYTVTFTEGVTDTFGQALPDPVVFTFTTGS
jgi:hypothetical protein